VQLVLNKFSDQRRFSYKIFFFSLILIFPLILLLNYFSLSTKSVVIIIGLPLISVIFFSFDAFKFFFIVSLFTYYYFFGLYLAVFIALTFFLSFLITHYNIQKDFFNTPLTLPFIIYYFSIIPSFINSSDILLSFYMLLNLHAVILLLLIFGYTNNDYKKIKNVISTFISLCIFDALVIIFYGLTVGGRVFGFSGIVFVDFSAISIITLLIYLLVRKGKYSYLFVIGILIVLAGLIFTQTRNTFLSLALTSITIFIYLIFKKNIFDISGKKLVGIFTTVIIVSTILFIILNYYTPDVFQRIEQVNKSSILSVKSETDIQKSSLITRFLIWDTAWNAFKAHPIIGIGTYSFPFESSLYYTIPKDLFKTYVEGNSPHITFLACLTETGILGLLGFLIFLFSSLKIGFKSVKKAVTENQKFYSLLILSVQIYIFYSMFLTDAWLWGQCGMLWGMVLGLSIANYKIITSDTQTNMNIVQ